MSCELPVTECYSSLAPDILVAYANAKRLGIKEPPEQSFFRVYALLVVRSQNKEHVVEGTNAEQGYIGGAICGERAAMCRLRLYPEPTILKVVVVTDSTQPISCGALCREYLNSHAQPDTPVIIGNHDGSTIVVSSLGHLQPFPYLYRFLKREDVLHFATDFATKCASIEALNSKEFSSLHKLALSHIGADAFDTIHPIKYAAAVQFMDGTTDVAWLLPGLEYGCSIDPVSQLVHSFEKRRFGAKNKSDQDKIDAQPDLLVCVDQFGVCHAPFAMARSLLTEHGYGALRFAYHTYTGDVLVQVAQSLLPVPSGVQLLTHDSFR
jgi:cytidine deaminase